MKRGCFDDGELDIEDCRDGRVDDGAIRGELHCCDDVSLCNQAQSHKMSYWVLLLVPLLYLFSKN